MTPPAPRDRATIAYLIDNFGHGGGTENHLHTLVSQLDQSRFDPIVIALGPRFKDFNITAPCEIVHLDWSRILHWRSFDPFLRLVRILRERRVRILQLFFPNSRFVGTLAALVARVPRIVIARRDCHKHPGGLNRLILWSTSLVADYCLANCHAAKAIVLQQEHFSPERIRVVLNSLSDIHQTLSEPRDGQDSSHLVIGIVANLRPVKRIDSFLRVAKQLSAEVDEFQVVGFGWDDEKQRYEQYARELGIAHQVRFRHTLTDVASYLREYSLGVLTSEAEGLSNALIEYAMSGLPAVAFDVGGNGEVIEHGVTGFLAPPGREDLLCYYIRLLVHSPALRQRMGRQARQRALKMFSVERMIRETESLYAELLL